MIKRRALDTFCCAGGATRGYQQAGFYVVGVDIAPQPRYIGDEFIQADALDVLRDRDFLATFDLIHASPPCQDYSKAMRHFTSGYLRLIGSVRERFQATGRPWVIENVVGAPLPAQDTLDGDYGITLCGTMFGLPVWYHRLFETSFPIPVPRGCNHSRRPLNPRRGSGPGRDTEAEWREAIGVPWAGKQGGREAIPPAYTEHIGRQAMIALEAAA